MALSAWTGASLEAEIKRYMEEEESDGGAPELDAEMATIFGLAELQLERDLALELANIEDATETMVAGTKTIAKADDCIAVQEVWYEPVGGGARARLEPRTKSYLQTYWPNDASEDVPLYWSEFSATHIMVAPTPNAAYPVIIQHTVRLDGLTPGDSGSTYLARVYPDALLYACLAWACGFMGDMEKATAMDTRYVGALPAAVQEQARKRLRTYSRPRAQPKAQEEQA